MWKDIETSEDLLGYRFHAKRECKLNCVKLQ